VVAGLGSSPDRFALLHAKRNNGGDPTFSHNQVREVSVRSWLIATTIITVAFGVGPLLSPSPKQDCQRGAEALPAPGETDGSVNLSDELSRSKGVICPPAGIDPGIAAPPVGGRVMPVIPPPGTPGGDPSIIPK
jgi:hypothetical protein